MELLEFTGGLAIFLLAMLGLAGITMAILKTLE